VVGKSVFFFFCVSVIRQQFCRFFFGIAVVGFLVKELRFCFVFGGIVDIVNGCRSTNDGGCMRLEV